MRVHTTRQVAFVVMLLCAACIGFLLQGPVYAAPQRNQVSKVYLPIVHVRGAQASGDLEVAHLGLYQSVQNQSNGVTLIARKPALLRVYAQATGIDVQATVTVDAHRDGQYLGSLTVGPQTVSAQPSADDLDSTFNFDLPIEWLDGQIALTATVDKANAHAETDEHNNTGAATFTFHNVPILDLTIVPITYVDVASGVTYTQAGHDPISAWLLSAFPLSEINVTLGEPMTFSGDLRRGEEWGRMLDELTARWTVEAGPGSAHLYIGLVPNANGGGDSWFEGGVSGMGWIGQRVSVVLDVGAETGESAGHEIGHNFGRRHAPCGNPSGVDPHFPYPNASIGVYGVDTAAETLLDPAQTHDMMSYCGPEWVSDYTYEGLFQDQFQRSDRAGTTAGEGLLIRAAIDGETVSPLPVLSLDQPFLSSRESTGEYSVQLLDENGAVIGVYPAELYEAEEMGVSHQMMVAHVPAPAGAQLGKVQFLSDDTLISEYNADALLAPEQP